MNLLNDLASSRSTVPISQFDRAKQISQLVYQAGSGVYLITRATQPELVRGAGWAESDYWACRAWELPFTGDLDVVPAPSHPLPSWASLGLPTPLQFGLILAHERSKPGWGLTSTTANYRLTDGGFLYVELIGTPRIRYFFGSKRPKKSEPPTAIEFRLD